MIILPQALHIVMPSMVSQLVVTVKSTTFGYVVTYPELIQNTKVSIANYNSLLPIYLATAIIYIVLNMGISRTAIWLSRRTGQAVTHSRMMIMHLLGNILWLVLDGLAIALRWLLIGFVLRISFIGILHRHPVVQDGQTGPVAFWSGNPQPLDVLWEYDTFVFSTGYALLTTSPRWDG